MRTFKLAKALMSQSKKALKKVYNYFSNITIFISIKFFILTLLIIKPIFEKLKPIFTISISFILVAFLFCKAPGNLPSTFLLVVSLQILYLWILHPKAITGIRLSKGFETLARKYLPPSFQKDLEEKWRFKNDNVPLLVFQTFLNYYFKFDLKAITGIKLSKGFETFVRNYLPSSFQKDLKEKCRCKIDNVLLLAFQTFLNHYFKFDLKAITGIKLSKGFETFVRNYLPSSFQKDLKEKCRCKIDNVLLLAFQTFLNYYFKFDFSSYFGLLFLVQLVLASYSDTTKLLTSAIYLPIYLSFEHIQHRFELKNWFLMVSKLYLYSDLGRDKETSLKLYKVLKKALLYLIEKTNPLNYSKALLSYYSTFSDFLSRSLTIIDLIPGKALSKYILNLSLHTVIALVFIKLNNRLIYSQNIELSPLFGLGYLIYFSYKAYQDRKFLQILVIYLDIFLSIQYMEYFMPFKLPKIFRLDFFKLYFYIYLVHPEVQGCLMISHQLKNHFLTGESDNLERRSFMSLMREWLYLFSLKSLLKVLKILLKVLKFLFVKLTKFMWRKLIKRYNKRFDCFPYTDLLIISVLINIKLVKYEVINLSSFIGLIYLIHNVFRIFKDKNNFAILSVYSIIFVELLKYPYSLSLSKKFYFDVFRLCFYTWLCHPKTKGSLMIYRKIRKIFFYNFEDLKEQIIETGARKDTCVRAYIEDLLSGNDYFCVENGLEYITQEIDPFFYRYTSKELLEIYSTHKMIPTVLPKILEDLTKAELDHDILSKLAKLVKNIAQESPDIFSLYSLKDILNNKNGLKVRSEIAYAIGYVLTDNKNPGARFIEDLQAEIQENVSSEPKDFLQQKLSQMAPKSQETKSSKLINHQKFIPGQLCMTKAQVKAHSKQTQKVSEDVKISQINLTKFLKTNMSILASSKTLDDKLEVLPPLQKSSKNTMSWIRDTYKEVKFQYVQAKADGKLADEVKDKYLPNKFNHKKFFLSFTKPLSLFTLKNHNLEPYEDKLKRLIVDRLIIKIYSIISKTQNITADTLDMLFSCLKPLESLRKMHFENITEETQAFVIYYICKIKPSNDIEDLLLSKLNSHPYLSSCLNWFNEIDTFPKVIKELAKIFDDELLAMKRDAVSAIFSLHLRKPITNIIKLEIIKELTQDPDSFCQLKALRILNSRTAYDSPELFEKNLSLLESNTDVDISKQALMYVVCQSANMEECKKIFDLRVVKRVARIIIDPNYPAEIRSGCCEAIGNYFDYLDRLNEFFNEVVENIANQLKSRNNDPEIEKEIIKLILLSGEKNRQLSDNIIEILLEKLKSIDEESGNLIIIAFSNAQAILRGNLFCLSQKLFDDKVIVRYETEYKFENLNTQNKENISISAITANLLLIQIQKGNDLSDQILENLVVSLQSKAKETRILATKCIYLLRKKRPLKKSLLLKIKDHVNDEAVNVSVFMKVIYTENAFLLCNQIREIISPEILDAFPQIYAFEQLSLGEEDFTKEVNSHILLTLKKEVDKGQKLNESLLEMLNQVLNNFQEEGENALDILLEYTHRKKRILQETILSVEEYIESKLREKALGIIENVIINGQHVSDTSLEIFLDDLYQKKPAYKSLKLLEIAQNNQDLPKSIHETLKIEKACSELETIRQAGVCNNQYKQKIVNIMNWLKKIAQNNQRFTFNVFKEFNKFIEKITFATEEDQQSLMKILLEVLVTYSKNRQTIPTFLAETLSRYFDKKKQENFQTFLCLFLNMTKNNQPLPRRVLCQLEEAFDQLEIEEDIIEIVILKVQAGEKFSAKVIQAILQGFINENNENKIKQNISVILYIIQTRADFDEKLAKQALVKITKLKDNSLKDKAIEGFQALNNRINFDKQTLDLLIELISECSSDTLNDNILKILKGYTLPKDLKNKLTLATLKTKSDAELLQEIQVLTRKGVRLVDSTFKKIQNIISQHENLTEKAVKVLIEAPNNENINCDLLEKIAKLIEDNMNSNKSLTKDCIILIKDIVKKKRIVSSTTLDSLRWALNVEDSEILDLAKETFFEISCNQSLPKEISDYLSLAQGKTQNDLNNLLEKARNVIENNMTLPSKTLQELKEYANKYRGTESELAEIFSYLLLRCQVSPDRELGILLEQAIINNKISKNVTNGYKLIMKSHFSQNIDAVVQALNHLVDKRNSNKENFMIMDCISQAAQLVRLSNQSLWLLEEKITCDNNCFRRLAYLGLRSQLQKGSKSDLFEKWCSTQLLKFEKESHQTLGSITDNDNLELLDTLSSLKYEPNYKLIEEKTRRDWEKTLLIHDFVSHCQNIKLDPMILSNLEIETLRLLTINQSIIPHSTMELIEIVPAIFEIGEKVCQRTLSEFAEDSCRQIKKEYLISILSHKISSISNLSEVMIDEMISIVNLIVMIVSKVEKIDDIQDLSKTVAFLQHHKISKAEIELITCNSLYELHKELEVSVLTSKFPDLAMRERLKTIFMNLLGKNWSFHELYSFLVPLNLSNIISIESRSILNMEYSLKIIENYNIPISRYGQLLAIFEQDFSKWPQKVHKIALDSNFLEKEKKKNQEELIKELKEKNPSMTEEELNKLTKSLEIIKDPHIKSSLYVNSESPEFIPEWTEYGIRDWVRLIKTYQSSYLENEEFIFEALAVIIRAVYLKFSYNPTDVQLIGCLLMYNAHHQSKNRLLQVATGEGKSTLTAMVAVLLSIVKRQKIDIITSSRLLAHRDARLNSQFYELFGLTVSDNNDRKLYISGAKECYKKDIVYGEVAQFQFDILRDEYSNLGTMCSRKQEIIIVDEADNPMLDDKSKIAKLTNSRVGTDLLLFIYFCLFQRCHLLFNSLIIHQSKLYLVFGKFRHEDERLLVEFSDEEGRTSTFDFEELLKNKDLPTGLIQEIKEDLASFITNHLENYLKELIILDENDAQDENIDKKFSLPKNLHGLVKTQISSWVRSAFFSFNYCGENISYIVSEGLVKPVDFENNGIIQNSTTWGDGLHQFLQIKHRLKMIPESFTTNFLSNVTFFKRYKTCLGLTGTLGSVKAREFFSFVYKVDLINIPQSYQKQYIQFPPTIAKDHSKWLQQILSTTMMQTYLNRGTLIICETIQDAQTIAQTLKQHKFYNVKLYMNNEIDQEKVVENIKQGEVIVATNLAGRGTDIQANDIEASGGLHVCVTFLPSNSRVEEQAFGRTSRQGKRGTGQLILNAEYLDYSGSIDSLQKRDLVEAEKLKKFIERDLKFIEIKDKFFMEICSFLRNLKNDLKKNKENETYQACVFASIEDRWADFLKMIDNNLIKIEYLEEEFRKLMDKLENDHKKKTLIENSFYHIQLAYDLLINDSIFNNKYQQSLLHFDLAINSDEQSSAAAFVGKAWRIIEGKKKLFSSEKLTNYKNQAKEYFEKALKLLNDEKAGLDMMYAILNPTKGNDQSDLSNQLIQKINILGTYIKNVNDNKDITKKSLRLMNLKIIEKNSKDNSLKTIKVYEEQDTKDILKLLQRLKEKYISFELTFNDLASFRDIKMKDQALQIINNILKDVCIELKNIRKEDFEALFNPGLKVTRVSKQDALTCLKKKRGFLNKICPGIFDSDVMIQKEDSESGFEKVKINDAIQKIKTSDDYASFSLEFLEGNTKASKMLEYLNRNKQYSMDLQVCDLESGIANEILARCNIYLKLIDLEFYGEKNEFSKLIDSIDCNVGAYIGLSEECLFYEKLDQNLAKRYQQEGKNVQIKIEKIGIEAAKKLIDLCPNSHFSLNLIDMNPNHVLEICRVYPNEMTLFMRKINKSQAIDIIPFIRKQNLEFSISFDNLSCLEIEMIMHHNLPSQEDLEITKTLKLSDFFLTGKKPEQELQEFASRGIERMFVLNEKRPVPWFSIATLVIIASVQITLGAVLVCSGFGANVGLALLTEGAVDLIQSAVAYKARKFTWSDYAKQKALSLTISAFSVGLTSLRDAGRGLKAFLQAGLREGVEQVGVRVLMNGNTVAQITMNASQKLKKLAFKQVGVAIGEQSLKYTLNSGASYLSGCFLDRIKPVICSYLEEEVQLKFSSGKFHAMISRFYAADLINNSTSQEYSSQLNKTIKETLDPEREFWWQQWKSVAGPLLKNSLSENNSLGLAFKIGGILRGSHQIITIIDTIYDKVLEKTIELNKNLLSAKSLRMGYQAISEAVESLVSRKIIDSQYITLNQDAVHQKESIDEAFTDEEKEIIKYLQKLENMTNKMKIEDINSTLKVISDMAIEQILRVIESQLILPLSSTMAGNLTKAISERVQHHFIVDKDDNAESQNKENSEGEFNTVEKQIRAHAQDYMTALNHQPYNSKEISADLLKLSRMLGGGAVSFLSSGAIFLKSSLFMGMLLKLLLSVLIIIYHIIIFLINLYIEL